MGPLHKLMLEKLKEGKTSEKGSKNQKAKLDVLREIGEMMKGMEGEKVKGLKKVTVMSDSPEGLKEGLEKAEDLLEAKEGGEEGEENLEKSEKEAELERLKELMRNKA